MRKHLRVCLEEPVGPISFVFLINKRYKDSAPRAADAARYARARQGRMRLKTYYYVKGTEIRDP